MLHDKNILAASAIALIVGIGAGYSIHGFISPSRGNGFPAGANGMGGFSSRTNQGANKSPNGLLSGTVAKQDAGSITLNTRDGSSRVVLITPATTVQKSVNGGLSDVTVGSTVFVSGSTNSDGSVSASSIQLRPETSPATVGQ